MNLQAAQSTGAYVPYRPVKELCLALAAVTLLTVLLAVLFSSPDERPSTIAQWARRDPIGFLTTATYELSGSSATAEYGPPYDHGSEGEQAGFLRPQKWLGVGYPIDTARDFVLGPLRSIPDRTLHSYIARFLRVSLAAKEDGLKGFEEELRHVSVAKDGSIPFRAGFYEHVDSIMQALLAFAQSGGLEGYLLAGQGNGYLRTDDTKPLLFMSDGGVLQARAARERLLDDKWPTMSETGGYPGLPWLWPLAVWYRIEPFKGSPNVDLLVMLVMAVLSLLFISIPFLPGIRDVPRALPLHRLIWRTRSTSA